jgi:hypothetical protein
VELSHLLVSGLTITTVTNPVDRVKIIMQSQNQKYGGFFFPFFLGSFFNF